MHGLAGSTFKLLITNRVVKAAARFLSFKWLTMRRFMAQIIVLTLSLCLIVVVLPRPGHASILAPGEASADQAALGQASNTANSSGEESASLRDGWRRAFAHSDTTGYEFPEEDEVRTTAGLVKDVVIWTAIAVFVAFFIVNVFLKGDDPEQDDDDGGKVIPPFSINPAPAAPPPS